MAAPKGHPRYGGRKKGTPNKATQTVREILALAGLDVPNELAKILPSLPVDLQVKVLLELMQYLYPKRASIMINDQTHLGLDPYIHLTNDEVEQLE